MEQRDAATTPGCASGSSRCASCARRSASTPTTTPRPRPCAQARRHAAPSAPASRAANAAAASLSRRRARSALARLAAGGGVVRARRRGRGRACNLAWLQSAPTIGCSTRSSPATSARRSASTWSTSRRRTTTPSSRGCRRGSTSRRRSTSCTCPAAVFVGGRVDYLDGRPVAALVYRPGRARRQRVRLADTGPRQRWPSSRPSAASRPRTGRKAAMTHWVVSDVSRDEFKAIVRAVQTADRDR